MDVQPTSFDNDINDRYAQFAADTYRTFERDIRTGLQSNGTGRSLLVVIAEEHQDTQQEIDANLDIPLEDQEPALAAAISEISALESASRLVGQDKLTLSVELDARTLSIVTNMIEDNDGIVPQNLQEASLAYTIAYAINNNIEIAPIDDGGYTGAARDEYMADAISSLYKQVDVNEVPNVVVHITGLKNLSNLAGISDDEINDSYGRVTADESASPFRHTFDQTLMYNTVRYPDELMDVFYKADHDRPSIKNLVSEIAFATNPDNATQIDSPGAMQGRDEVNLSSLVQNAANNHALGLASKDTENPIQLANVDMNKM